MIHYTCDCCKRELEADELRYVVRMEVFAALDPAADEELEDDRDHLQEIQDVLARTDVDDADSLYEQRRYDLCPLCRKRFLQHPLGREFSKQLDFSAN